MTTLITGGAGFVGTNLAARLLRDGRRVLILDSLARPGVEENLRWLRDTFGSRLSVEIGDVRNAVLVRSAVAKADAVFHFAAQVAVTTSLTDPLEDFEVNARGTLNVLEAIRARTTPPALVFTSTNKVYGALDDLSMRRANLRYVPTDEATASGIGEQRPLDFHSPYGCSKGAADQYVRDYARTFGIPAIVFRMSCIYGPHQFGTEDQGWVAHFVIQALEGRPITLYGDGRQVRDVLYVGDLVDAFRLAMQRMATESGQAFNIGGGPDNAVSLLELLDRIAEITGRRPDVRFDAWRPGDQKYYVSDTTTFEQATGWRPKTGVRQGLQRLTEWLARKRSQTRIAKAAAGAGR
jgi:CDP-paratose 2-epimerase